MNFKNPVKILKTNNWKKKLNSTLEKLRIQSPLIITSQGNLKRLNLDKLYISAQIYSIDQTNPTFEDCKDPWVNVATN